MACRSSTSQTSKSWALRGNLVESWKPTTIENSEVSGITLVRIGARYLIHHSIRYHADTLKYHTYRSIQTPVNSIDFENCLVTEEGQFANFSFGGRPVLSIVIRTNEGSWVRSQLLPIFSWKCSIIQEVDGIRTEDHLWCERPHNQLSHDNSPCLLS